MRYELDKGKALLDKAIWSWLSDEGRMTQFDRGMFGLFRAFDELAKADWDSGCQLQIAQESTASRDKLVIAHPNRPGRVEVVSCEAKVTIRWNGDGDNKSPEDVIPLKYNPIAHGIETEDGGDGLLEIVKRTLDLFGSYGG